MPLPETDQNRSSARGSLGSVAAWLGLTASNPIAFATAPHCDSPLAAGARPRAIARIMSFAIAAIVRRSAGLPRFAKQTTASNTRAVSRGVRPTFRPKPFESFQERSPWPLHSCGTTPIGLGLSNRATTEPAAGPRSASNRSTDSQRV